MAMARSLMRAASTLPRLYVKRTMYTHWHLTDMNLEDGKKRDETLKDLWHRRQVLGPDPVKPRSEDLLWNYEAELFAFGKRLGEEFRMVTLRRAFEHSGYTPETSEPGSVSNEKVPSKSNEDLIKEGEQLMERYVKAYVRYHYPKLPEEGIRTIAAYLCSEKQLAYLANNLGMFDLTLAPDFPYGEKTMANTFKAIIGALKADSGEQKAEYFVQDFVLTELVDLDVNEIFYVKNPVRILAAILEKEGRGAPEPRIIRQTGTFSVTPTYVIGIYVDRQLLGQAPGESTQIAEEMAARDCLKTLWNTHTERRVPLAFGQREGRALDLSSCKDTENESLRSYLDFGEEQELLGNAFEDEPFDMDELYDKYKEEIEPALGNVYRKRLKHAFYHGSIFKKKIRPMIAPNVKTI